MASITACASTLSAYYMKWKDFAVQVEDPQPAVFQLGFVNLPTAEIKGIEGDFAFSVTDEWQIDGYLRLQRREDRGGNDTHRHR